MKNNASVSINSKLILKGGNRITPIDEEKSLATGSAVYEDDLFLQEKAKDFMRLDVSSTYRKNLKKFSYEISLDIQNMTNRKNIYNSYWNKDKGKVENYYFPGLIPILNVRLVF